MPELKKDVLPSASQNVRIFAPGSCVKCGDHSARIVSVNLRESVFVYQVSWWVGGERRVDTISACELTAVDETKYWTLDQN